MKHQSTRTAWSRGGTIAAIGVVGALALTGCTGNSSDSSAEPRELVSQTDPAAGPINSFVWNLPTGEPASIDPPNAPTYSGAGVVSNLCDSLLTHDADYNLAPGIADYTIVSPTQIAYEIRDGATFWDGSPVTAEDVAFSLQRSAAPEALVSFIYASVASIDVTGDHEVTVTFTQPDELFNVEMTTFAGMVVKKEFAEAQGADFGTAAGGLMCSGPFQLEEWVAGDHITISRNDAYWDEERVPLAESVKFTFVSDSTAYTQAMAAGEIDGSYEISASAIPVLEKSDRGSLYFGPSMQSLNLSVARPDGPLSDIDLRTAFQTLIDRQAVADVVFHGAASPLYTVLAPATWQNEALETYEKAYEPFVEERAFDVDKAKGLVEGSSYAGEDIVIAIPAGDETLSKVAQLIQQQAKAAGVTVELSALQPLDYAAASYDPAKRVGIDMILASSFNGVQDPLEPYGFLYLPGAFYNLTEYSNDRVTELMQAARASFDAQERADMFVEIQTEAESASANIPIVSTNTVTFLNNDLLGAVTSFAYLTMPSLVFVGSSK